MEIERETLKKIMKHLSICEANLNVHLKHYIETDIARGKEEFDDWKKYGMSSEWIRRQNYWEEILKTIKKESKFYGETCKELEKIGLKVEDWIFMEV